MNDLDLKVLRNTLIMGLMILAGTFCFMWGMANMVATDAFKASIGATGSWLLGYAQRTGGFLPSKQGFLKQENP